MISICARGLRKFVHVIALLYLALTFSATGDHAAISDNCEFEIEFINILLDRCIEVKLGARLGDCLGSLSIGPFEMYICNDRNYTFMIDRVYQMSPQVIFSLSYCKPYCIITTNVSNTCHFYNFTKTDNNLKNHTYDVCINESNYNNCLPTIGRNASCWPSIELMIITKDGKFELYLPSKSDSIECPRYLDPVSITIGSRLIQLCNYRLEPIESDTVVNDSSISHVVKNLLEQASVGCQKFLKNCTNRILTEVESVTSLLDPQSQECLKNDSDISDSVTPSCYSSAQKGTPSRRTNVSVGFSEGSITLTNSNCSSVNVYVCVNNLSPELLNIDPLRLQVSSEDIGLVIEPNILEISVNQMSNPTIRKCVSVTVTMDTCDYVKNVTIVVEAVKDNGNLEYHVVYNNNNFTIQITNASESDTSNNKAISAAVIIAMIVTAIVIIILLLSLAAFVGTVVKKKKNM